MQLFIIFFSIAVQFFSIQTCFAKIQWSYVETRDNIKIHKSDSKELGSIIPFMAEGPVEADMEDVLKLLLNYEKKPLWAPKLMEVNVHKRTGDAKYIFSEIYYAPWPFKNREFLLEGKIVQNDPDQVSILGKGFSLKEGQVFLRDDTISCDIRFVRIHLTRVSKGKSFIRFEFFGDMGGWIPTWIANMIQKRWPAKFILGLRNKLSEGNLEESEIYQDYLKNIKP